MTEFVKEVEEEYRRAQIAAIFKKYGNIIIGGLLLVIIGIGGWQFLEWRQNQAARQGAVAFERALKLAGEEKGKEAEEAFVAIGKESGNPYAPLARFRSAAELARLNAADGQKAFEALAADASVEQPLRELARLRAAMIAVDSEPYDAIVKRVGDLATPGHMWRSSAREVLGLSAFKAGDMDKAGAHYQDIALDPEAPQQMKTRAEIVIEMTRGLSTK